MNKKEISDRLNEALSTNIGFYKLTNQEINQLVDIFSNPQKLMVSNIKNKLTGLFQQRVDGVMKQILNGQIIKKILG